MNIRREREYLRRPFLNLGSRPWPCIPCGVISLKIVSSADDRWPINKSSSSYFLAGFHENSAKIDKEVEGE